MIEALSTAIKSRPHYGELSRFKAQVVDYAQAVQIANKYKHKIIDVSGLKPNLKFIITFVKYKEL